MRAVFEIARNGGRRARFILAIGQTSLPLQGNDPTRAAGASVVLQSGGVADLLAPLLGVYRTALAPAVQVTHARRAIQLGTFALGLGASDQFAEAVDEIYRR